MPRRPRSLLPDGVYHVTTRGVAQMAIFIDTLHYRTFFDIFDATALRFEWYAHRYCALPNHFHLIVETTRARLSQGMHRLNFLRVIEDETHFEAACEYVDLNPVRAGLCARPEEWPWSSAHEAAQIAASILSA